jgi:hypothetical protein
MSEERSDSRPALATLAEKLCEHSGVTEPPVPIEQMLEEPPPGLDKLDLDQISSVMEHGLYSHAPRLAMARLLCREIARSKTARALLGVDVPIKSYEAIKYFARCLLMPSHWIRQLSEQGLSIEQISTYLQAPSYAVVTRLAELDLPIPDER